MKDVPCWKMVNCDGPATVGGCDRCGWNDAEIQRRRERIKTDGLKQGKDGLYRLVLRRPGAKAD